MGLSRGDPGRTSEATLDDDEDEEEEADDDDDDEDEDKSDISVKLIQL